MRIFIAEDHLMVRDVVRKACAAEPGYSVVGETESGLQAVELVTSLQPDILILDLSLPDIDGFNVMERLAKVLPTLKVLMLSSHYDNYTLFRVEKSGAKGFIDKTSNTVESLRDALQAVSQGRTYFSPVFLAAQKAMHADPNSFIKLLSDWERAILCLIGQGLTDDEIAARMNLSPNTARTHRGNILRKLEIKSTPKLIAYAIEHGFTQVQVMHGTIPAYT